MAPYGQMEQVLQLINNKFVSLNEEEVKYSNCLIRNSIEKLLIPIMKKDALFKEIYTTIDFGGSFYDGLKVGKPDEFDLDIKLSVPKCLSHNLKNCSNCLQIISSNQEPGFVCFKVKETVNKEFNKFICKDGFLQNKSVLKKWFKRIVNLGLENIQNEFTEETGFKVLGLEEKEPEIEEEEPDIIENGVKVKYHSESGPALTLRVEGEFGPIDIDFVPAFEFDFNYRPKNILTLFSNSFKNSKFLVVPKTIVKNNNCERFWRLSFQKQERELLHKQERLKSALKLLKKMRTSLIHKKISSYALKSMVLWDLACESFDYTKNLSECFMHLVEMYKDTLYEKNISYYWDPKNNLLRNIKDETLEIWHNQVSNLLKQIKKEPSNPYNIAKLILKDKTPEYEELISVMEKDDEKYQLSKYNYEKMDPYLKDIITYFNSMDNERNIIQSFIREKLIPLTKNRDSIFKAMYQEKHFFGDNYFNTMTRYTAYLVFTLPKCEICNKKGCDCVTIASKTLAFTSGFMCLKIKDHDCASCNIFKTNKNLNGDRILKWLRHLFSLVLSDLSPQDLMDSKILGCKIQYRPPCYITRREFQQHFLNAVIKNYEESFHPKSYYSSTGPAITLRLTTNYGTTDVDVVPALKFNFVDLPENINLHLNPTKNKNDVFMVPVQDDSICEEYWWPCFHDQEEELLKDKKILNSAFKLLKKTRDSLRHWQISDYELKTILLWDIEKNNTDWNKSLGNAFMYMLQIYEEKLCEKKIAYYWRKNNNLWERLHPDTLMYYLEEIKSKILEIKRNFSTQPEFVAKIVLGDKNYNKFIEDKSTKNKNVSQYRTLLSIKAYSSSDSDSDLGEEHITWHQSASNTEAHFS